MRRKRAILVGASSTIVSMTRSASATVSWLMAAGGIAMSPASCVARMAPASRLSGMRPASRTSQPAVARAAAISGPIAPVPMTTAFTWNAPGATP